MSKDLQSFNIVNSSIDESIAERYNALVCETFLELAARQLGFRTGLSWQKPNKNAIFEPFQQ